jgi:hypothetical protein
MITPKIKNIETLQNYKLKLFYETGEVKILGANSVLATVAPFWQFLP